MISRGKRVAGERRERVLTSPRWREDRFCNTGVGGGAPDSLTDWVSPLTVTPDPGDP